MAWGWREAAFWMRSGSMSGGGRHEIVEFLLQILAKGNAISAYCNHFRSVIKYRCDRELEVIGNGEAFPPVRAADPDSRADGIKLPFSYAG